MNKNEDRILEAALTVVQEHTISGTRMHLIAEQAQMTQSNLHYYYKTKYDLMLALQKKVLEKCIEIRSDLGKESEDSFESQLDIFLQQKKIFIKKYKQYDFAEIDFWIQGNIYAEMKSGFSESFSGWRMEIAEILNRYVEKLPENIKQYLPFQIVSLMEGATIQYLIDEGCFELEEYFEACKNMIINTVAPYRS